MSTRILCLWSKRSGVATRRLKLTIEVARLVLYLVVPREQFRNLAA